MVFNADNIERITDGFPSQILRQIPAKVFLEQGEHPLLKDLQVTSTGYFPSALGHHIERPEGSPEHIVIYCLEGRGWYRFAEGEIDIGPGEVLVCIKGQRHAYGSDDDHPWTIQWAHFLGSQCPHMFEALEIDDTRPVFSLGKDPEVSNAFSQLTAAIEEGYGIHHVIYASALLKQIFGRMIFARNYATRVKGDACVDRVIEYMQEHLDEHFELQDFVEVSGNSKAHFSRKFRSVTGYPPVEYFIRMRIQKACEHLATADLKISEVGLRVGYSDPYYFSKTFRRVMGFSPRVYRESFRK